MSLGSLQALHPLPPQACFTRAQQLMHWVVTVSVPRQACCVHGRSQQPDQGLETPGERKEEHAGPRIYRAAAF